MRKLGPLGLGRGPAHRCAISASDERQQPRKEPGRRFGEAHHYNSLDRFGITWYDLEAVHDDGGRPDEVRREAGMQG